MSEKPLESACQPQRKAQYCSPHLVEYGSVTELTLSGSGTQGDGTASAHRPSSKTIDN